MMSPTAVEFAYRLPRRVGGGRPGAHPGTAIGAGLEFRGHRRLFDHPDPRRLDLRASLADLRGEWLVRVHRQRAAIPIQVLADVSASMRFGAPGKLELVARFVEALGRSAFRIGDAVGLVGFDVRARPDLHAPPRRGRAVGDSLAAALRASPVLDVRAAGDGAGGIVDAARRLGAPSGLVFIASDFHWPLERLPAVLDGLSGASVVPIVTWDPAEMLPPEADGLVRVADAETGHRRTLWLRPSLRTRWRAAVDARRADLERVFAARHLRPFWMMGEFDAAALTRHFLEERA